MNRRLDEISGWGRAPKAMTDVRLVTRPNEVLHVLRDAALRGAIPRGLGRSYGDASQRSGGVAITLGPQDRIEWLGGNRLKVDGGVSFDRLIAAIVPRGFFVPVTPGTRQVTVGGAVAADVHGKNHHRDGSLGQHVDSLRLVIPSGEELEVSPTSDADLFWATVGGMGLTGLITSVVMRLLPIETSSVLAETHRISNFEGIVSKLSESDERYRYSVALIDLMATGDRFGRGLLMEGNHAAVDSLPEGKRDNPLAYRRPRARSIPAPVPFGLINRVTARAFNEVWYRKTPRGRTVRLKSIPEFFHPLDGIANWNALYGPKGMLQYQFVLPFEEEDALLEIGGRIARSGFPSSLTVLKRMGPASDGMLSFPMAGWTLAVDFPMVVSLRPFLDLLDELVAEAGGRLYLAKDSRMSPLTFRRTYPRLSDFGAVRRRVDPDGLLRSDLSMRLEIP